MKYEWDKNKIMKELKIIFSSSFLCFTYFTLDIIDINDKIILYGG